MLSGRELPYTPSVIFARARQIRARQAFDQQQKRQFALAQDAQRRQRQLAQDALKPGKAVKPVHPNQGIEAAYLCILKKLIAKMNSSVEYWISASFKANEPEVTDLAQDANLRQTPRLGQAGTAREAPRSPTGYVKSSGAQATVFTSVPPEQVDALGFASDALPATELRRSVRKLARRWQRKFNEAAPELADWFLQSVETRSSLALQNILKRGGWTVDFKMTKAQRDVMRAAINENVSLIKSIPSQYFTQIEGMVMRSVTTGRDLEQLTKDLKRQFRVTERRAQLIARDQTNKSTAVLTRTRHLELGLTKAIWQHSHGGRHPRPTHLANSGKEYDVREGWLDPAVGRRIWPGTEINCRCISRPKIPGFE
jgi:SPP1 gp7 family putative phage head morphogenesis protein